MSARRSASPVNVRARIRAVVPVEIVEEFVDRLVYVLEVEWLESGS
jgi:hypothetical protein